LVDERSPEAPGIVECGEKVQTSYCFPKCRGTPYSIGVLDIVRWWSATTSHSLREQLENGARYFDIRLALDLNFKPNEVIKP